MNIWLLLDTNILLNDFELKNYVILYEKSQFPISKDEEKYGSLVCFICN